jgi:hypothetical protein
MADLIVYRPPIPSNSLHANIKAYMGYGKDYPLKIFVGLKGIGKTFFCKELITNRFLYKNTKFVWLRDTEGAVENMAKDGDKFFDIALRKNFPDTQFKLNNGLFYINNKVAGSLESVSTFYKQKGNDYSDYATVIFDEAIPEKVQTKQVGFFTKLSNVISQVGRLKDNGEKGNIEFIFTANALNRGADVLIKFGFTGINKYGIYLNKSRGAMLVYLPDSDKYQEAVSKSVAGKLLKGTETEANILHGQFTDNTDNLIDFRVPSTVWYVVHTKDGVFNFERALAPFNLWYVTKHKAGSFKGKWVTNDTSLQNKTIKYDKYIKKNLQKYIDYGIIEYEDMEVRDIFSSFIN